MEEVVLHTVLGIVYNGGGEGEPNSDHKFEVQNVFIAILSGLKRKIMTKKKIFNILHHFWFEPSWQITAGDRWMKEKKEHAALENHDDELSSRRSVLLASLLHLVPSLRDYFHQL